MNAIYESIKFMISEKQVQDIAGIRINMNQILLDCQSLESGSYRDIIPKRSLRLKTEPCPKINLSKSFDFDNCVNNINTKVRLFQSAKLSSHLLLKSTDKKKLSMSEKYIINLKDSPLKSPFQTGIKADVRKSCQLPRLMAKYQKAYSPRNASSSYKCFLLQKQQNNVNQSQNSKNQESYHSIVGERKLKEDLKYILVMGRVIRENLVREKKMLQQRKKKRKLENLKIKEILLFKRSPSNKL